MSSEWPLVSFDQVKASAKSAFAMGPFGSNIKAENFTTSGVPVIKGGNLNGTYIHDSFTDFLTEDKAAELASSQARPLDIVITHRGTLGQVGLIPERSRYPYYIVSQSQLKLSFDLARVDPYFIYYFLRSPLGQQRLLANTSQVGVPAIAQALTTIRQIQIALPSLEEQRNICSMLRLLDDRITLLRETNATLEAIAQALFKSWFVDFDPVRAKMEGRTPEGMDEATAALFPDGFETSELGEVPRGWRYSTVGESFVLTMGQSPPGDTYNDSGEGLAFYQGRTDFGFRFPTQRVFCSAPTRYAEPGDTLVSVRAPVGDVNMALERCCIGRGVASVRHSSGFRGFVFYAMHGLRERFKTFDSEGTVFGSISKKDFQSLPVVVAPEDVLRAYDAVAAPIDQRIAENEVMLRTLSTLRDTLLPRLISGQLRLPEAQAALKTTP